MRTREEVVEALTSRGVPKDRAVQYADAAVDYWAASENIAKNGTVVAHPRTGQPLQNPYVGIRADALKRLATFRDLGAKVGDLW
jgi:hypothetical protein